MEKILICGDSFAADWSDSYAGIGWPNILKEKFDVYNLAQAGCSQFKIYKQIISEIDNLYNYKHIIIGHTSPYRIYTTNHPCYKKTSIHRNSDFIYADVKQKVKHYPELKCITEYYESFYDLEYAEFMHICICEKIDLITKGHPSILNISGFNYQNLYSFPNFIGLSNLYRKHKGLINHLDQCGNEIVYKKIMKKINEN